MSIIKPLFGTPLNRAHPLAAGLVGAWLFNENSGNRAWDASGCENHGTLTNMADPPSATSGWGPGPHGGALAFDGGNDRIVMGGPVGVMPNFSVKFRIYPYELKNYAPQVGNLNGWGAFYFHASAAGQLYVGTDISTRWVLTGSIVTNQWQDFVYTINNNAAKIYKNGILLASKTQTTPTAWTGFCTSFYADGYSIVSISEIFIYNRALSAEEIAFLYAFPFCMFEEMEYPAWMVQNNIPIFDNYYRQMRAA